MKILTTLFVSLIITLGLTAQIPAGYYDAAAGKTGAELKTALYDIIKGHSAVSYATLWTSFQTTDKRADGKVWDMYSNCTYTFGSDQCGSYGGECDCYNREHSWPKSWFNDATPMYTDLFHIVPTDGYVNGRRSNYPFGTVSSPTYTSGNGSKLGSCSYPGYTGIVFEPIDEYKGDFARNYFYMATRYENVISVWHSYDANAEAVLQANSFPVFEDWFKNLLLAWNNSDPVSAKEIARNNAVYAIQHNRNPFIDHNEYVASVWGSGTVLPEPSNHVLSFATGSRTSTTIPLTWNNNDGAQPADKYLVLINTTGTFASPADGTPVSDDLNLGDNAGAVNVVHSAQAYTFTALTPGTTYYFKIFPYTNAAASINYKTDGTVPEVSAATLSTPQLAVNPATLSDFSYGLSSGPSASQSYTLSGAALTPASGTITVTGTASFEVSTDNNTFGNTATVNYSLSTLANTLVYTRLKAGLAAGSYTSQNVSNAGGGSATVNVSCSGSVSNILPEPTNYATNLSGNSILLEWSDALGGVQPSGYLVRRSSTGFDAITVPSDGITYSATGDMYVPFGQEYVWVKDLAAATTYFFKLFPYTGSGNSIDYKTDGSVPQVQKTTEP